MLCSLSDDDVGGGGGDAPAAADDDDDRAEDDGADDVDMYMMMWWYDDVMICWWGCNSLLKHGSYHTQAFSGHRFKLLASSGKVLERWQVGTLLHVPNSVSYIACARSSPNSAGNKE